MNSLKQYGLRMTKDFIVTNKKIENIEDNFKNFISNLVNKEEHYNISNIKNHKSFEQEKSPMDIYKEKILNRFFQSNFYKSNFYINNDNDFTISHEINNIIKNEKHKLYNTLGKELKEKLNKILDEFISENQKKIENILTN